MTHVPTHATEAMLKLVRKLAGGFHDTHINPTGIEPWSAVSQAQYVVSMLPQPVDPDLVLARQVALDLDGGATAQDESGDGTLTISMNDYYDGKHDNGHAVRSAYFAIKRVRRQILEGEQ